MMISFFFYQGKDQAFMVVRVCLLIKHDSDVFRLNVDVIIRAGIRKFSDEVGRLWTCITLGEICMTRLGIFFRRFCVLLLQ